ncbi:unnamed protein product [Wuchereria bancrofti]|uniref:Uncharacterized protein n=1 Tax=Wuchereria bancrofti TaxID=6293 RepID=A0A3P7EGA3_WUCBA|nr:unnamed protein product [Wuchereria bancrofti]
MKQRSIKHYRGKIISVTGSNNLFAEESLLLCIQRTAFRKQQQLQQQKVKGKIESSRMVAALLMQHQQSHNTSNVSN